MSDDPSYEMDEFPNDSVNQSNQPQQQQQQQQQQLYQESASSDPTSSMSYHPTDLPLQSQSTLDQSSQSYQQQQQQQQQPHPLPSLSDSVLRPTIPPYLHSSLSVPPPQHPSHTPVIDPRATPEYQVAWELELWRRTEMKAQQDRWAVEEAARMAILEEEFAKGMKAEEAKLQVRLLKIQQTEKQLTNTQLDLEKQKASIRLQQSELASRVASLDKELAKYKGEADAFVTRMKDQTSYEVNKSKAQLKDAQTTIDLLRKELRATQSKLSESREEHEKDRLKHAKSNFGAVESQLRKREDELESMTNKYHEACKERDHEKERLAAALGKGMALYKQIEDMKAEALEVKNRDADFLRAQYLAKERQSGASRSVQEAHEIMKQVKAHLLVMSGPTKLSVTDLPVHQPAQLHPTGINSVPPHSTANQAFNSFQQQPSYPHPFSHSQTTSTGTGPNAAASLASRSKNVPEPYHYLMHEQETLNHVRQERVRT